MIVNLFIWQTLQYFEAYICITKLLHISNAKGRMYRPMPYELSMLMGAAVVLYQGFHTARNMLHGLQKS